MVIIISVLTLIFLFFDVTLPFDTNLCQFLCVSNVYFNKFILFRRHVCFVTFGDISCGNSHKFSGTFGFQHLSHILSLHVAYNIRYKISALTFNQFHNVSAALDCINMLNNVVCNL